MRYSRQYRHELKYWISRGDYEVLRQRFGAVMKRDSHTKNGVYRITSLYFDDIYGTAYREKSNGMLYRKKFRIRSYELDPNFIRLEEKCKENNVGYKKSAVLTRDEYTDILNGKTAFLADERFMGTAAEDFFYSTSTVYQKPAVIVDYLREPYLCDAGNVRLTFDSALSVCVNTFDMFDEKARFAPVFERGEILLEIKYDNYLPAYIEQLLTGVTLNSDSVSKFILCSDKAKQLRYGI